MPDGALVVNHRGVIAGFVPIRIERIRDHPGDRREGHGGHHDHSEDARHCAGAASPPADAGVRPSFSTVTSATKTIIGVMCETSRSHDQRM